MSLRECVEMDSDELFPDWDGVDMCTFRTFYAWAIGLERGPDAYIDYKEGGQCFEIV